MITIQLNGRPKELPDRATVADLLRAIEAPEDGIAVERNGSIVRRREFGAVQLEPGDRVELVTLVGGG